MRFLNETRSRAVAYSRLSGTIVRLARDGRREETVVELAATSGVSQIEAIRVASACLAVREAEIAENARASARRRGP